MGEIGTTESPTEKSISSGRGIGQAQALTHSLFALCIPFRPHGLFFLLVLALILRLAILALAGLNAPLAGDEVQYQQLAANVAAGRGFVQNNNPFFPGQILYAWQAPLYPLSLAVLYFFFGPHPIIAKLFGILLGVATVYVTYDLAARVFPRLEVDSSELLSGDRTRFFQFPSRKGWNGGVAWLAGLIVAIYPGFLTNAHLLFSETLFTLLLVLAFDLLAASVARLDEKRPRGLGLMLAAGAVWGAATLTRGIALYFAAPLVLWLLLVLPGQKGAARGLSLPRAILAAVIFVGAMCAVIAPWTLRNYTVLHRFVLLETKGGVNFWLGNSRYTPNDFIRNVWKVGVREPMLAVLPPDEYERDRAAYALGLDYIAHNPLTFITRMPVKFADLWGFERNLVDVAEATQTKQGGGWNSISKLAADLVSDGAYVILVCLAIGGLAFGPEDRRPAAGQNVETVRFAWTRWILLLGGFLAYFVLVHITIFGDGRFHFPLVPFLALYAGWFILHRASATTWRRARIVLALSLVLVFAAVWLHEIAAAAAVLRA